MRGGVKGVIAASVAVALAMLIVAFSGQAQAALTCDGKKVTIKGSNGDDVLKGTTKNDVIAGRGGADTLKGRGGNDRMCGGKGPDKSIGAAGYDRILDESTGPDTLTGGPDVDVCSPQRDEDTWDCDFSTEDPVIFAPFNKAASPGSLDVASVADIVSVDLYGILDRSGSMSTELVTVKNNLATVVSNLQCGPGEVENCIPDLWAGAGTVGYSGVGGAPFTNHVDVQPNPSFTSVPTTEPGGCCAEPLNFSVFAAITGQGGGASYGISTTVPPRATCAGSPAANAGYTTFGYPCFRSGALPVVALATDEQPLSTGDTNKSPAWATMVKPAMIAAGARFVGILGSAPGAGVQTDLQTMATDTGAVDATSGNAPLVFNGADANAATAIENGIRALADGLPLDVRAEAVDDASDSVNAVVAFVDHVEVLPSGSAECSASFGSDDTNEDSFDDLYVGVTPGTSLCWRLVAKQNQTVPASDSAQVFRATVAVIGNAGQAPDQHEVFFVVPGAN